MFSLFRGNSKARNFHRQCISILRPSLLIIRGSYRPTNGASKCSPQLITAQSQPTFFHSTQRSRLQPLTSPLAGPSRGGGFGFLKSISKRRKTSRKKNTGFALYRQFFATTESGQAVSQAAKCSVDVHHTNVCRRAGQSFCELKYSAYSTTWFAYLRGACAAAGAVDRLVGISASLSGPGVCSQSVLRCQGSVRQRTTGVNERVAVNEVVRSWYNVCRDNLSCDT